MHFYNARFIQFKILPLVLRVGFLILLVLKCPSQCAMMVIVTDSYFVNVSFGRRKNPIMRGWKNNSWHIYAEMETHETKLHVSMWIPPEANVV